MTVDAVEGVNDRNWGVEPLGAVAGRALGLMAPVNHFGREGKMMSAGNETALRTPRGYTRTRTVFDDLYRPSRGQYTADFLGTFSVGWPRNS